jgi:hypothetical protein
LWMFFPQLAVEGMKVVQVVECPEFKSQYNQKKI